LHFGFIVEKVPLENLLAETDSPYLHPDKDFPNEPGNVIESYKKIAKIKNLSLEEIEKKLETNYNKLF
jgi:Tat protein secretion system quality control protein TatD with DNase activity